MSSGLGAVVTSVMKLDISAPPLDASATAQNVGLAASKAVGDIGSKLAAGHDALQKLSGHIGATAESAQKTNIFQDLGRKASIAMGAGVGFMTAGPVGAFVGGAVAAATPSMTNWAMSSPEHGSGATSFGTYETKKGKSAKPYTDVMGGTSDHMGNGYRDASQSPNIARTVVSQPNQGMQTAMQDKYLDVMAEEDIKKAERAAGNIQQSTAALESVDMAARGALGMKGANEGFSEFKPKMGAPAAGPAPAFG